MTREYPQQDTYKLQPIDVRRFGFKMSDMSSRSIKEQVLLVQLGRFVNELALFHKLIYISIKHDGFGEIETAAMDSQTQSLLLILIGKLNEAYELVRNLFDKAGIKKNYLLKFDGDGKAAYYRIKKYFGGRNNINIIRKKIAFHHDSDLIEHLISSCSQDDIFTIIIHPQPANCYFHISHEMLFKVLVSTEGDDPGAVDRLVKEVLEMGGVFMKFFVECMRVFWEESGDKFKFADTHQTVNAVNLDAVMMPYFMLK